METLKFALAPAEGPPLKPDELMAKLFNIADVHVDISTHFTVMYYACGIHMLAQIHRNYVVSGLR